MSASFFSLGIPGEEQEVGLGSEDPPSGVEPVVEEGEGEALEVWPSEVAAFPRGPFVSCGGCGLRKVSLPTEMKALPGVEKGSGPWPALEAPLDSGTLLSALGLS